MKTLLPIVISLGLLIPFSPVGEFLWHAGQQRVEGWSGTFNTKSTAIVNQLDLSALGPQTSQLPTSGWRSVLNHKKTEIVSQWQVTMTTLQAKISQDGNQLVQDTRALTQGWQQQGWQWTTELGQQWQSIGSFLAQQPGQLWQAALNSGESHWANLQQRQAQLQSRISHSLTELEANSKQTRSESNQPR